MPDKPILLLLSIEEKSDYIHFNHFHLIPNMKNYVKFLHFKEKFNINLVFSSNCAFTNFTYQTKSKLKKSYFGIIRIGISS